MPITDIVRNAHAAMRDRYSHYIKYHKYLIGDHPLVYASENYSNVFGDILRTLVDNRLPAIASCVADKLQIEAIRVDESKQKGVDKWMHKTLFKRKVAEACQRALNYGDAYVILAMTKSGLIKPYLQAPGCVQIWSEDETGEPEGAIKFWPHSDGRWRLTVWDVTGMTRYVAKDASDVAPDTLDHFIETEHINLGLSRIPVFSILNNPDDMSEQGQSLLTPVLPMQDMLNKAWSDMAVTMEFSAYPQRWVTGVDPRMDEEGNEVPYLTPGIERLLTSSSPDSQFGSFNTADLTQYTAVIDKVLQAMASSARVPVHAFAPGGVWPSGEAMLKAEGQLIANAKDLMEDWGNTVEQMLTLAMEWQGVTLEDCECEWVSIDQKDEKAEAETDKIKVDTQMGKVELGLSPNQALREMGYTDDQILEFASEKVKDTAGAAALAAQMAGEV